MEEREKEIKVHKETLVSEIRRVEDERHKVQMELSERDTQVKNLKVKFESLVKKNRPSNEETEEKSQAY